MSENWRKKSFYNLAGAFLTRLGSMSRAQVEEIVLFIVKMLEQGLVYLQVQVTSSRPGPGGASVWLEGDETAVLPDTGPAGAGLHT